MSEKTETDILYIVLIITAGIIYFLFLNFCKARNYTGNIGLLIYTYLLPTYGYALVYSIGIRCRHIDKRNILLLSAFLALIVGHRCCSVGMGNIIYDKYPPGSLYLSYGVLVSIILFLLLRDVRANRFVTWASMFSLEIYYCHCFAIAFMDAFCVEWSFILRYIIALAFGFGGAALYIKLKKHIIGKKRMKVA